MVTFDKGGKKSLISRQEVARLKTKIRVMLALRLRLKPVYVQVLHCPFTAPFPAAMASEMRIRERF